MNLKEFIFKLLKEGKNLEEIKSALADFDGDFTAEDVKEVLNNWDARKTKLAELAKLTAKSSTDEAGTDTKAFGAEVEGLKTQVKELTEKLNKSLELIELQSKEKPAYEFKSFMREFQVIQDHQWRKDFLNMLIAHKNKDYNKAHEYSAKFLENAKLLRGDAVSGSYAVPEEYSDLVFSIAQLNSNLWAKATKMVQASGDKMYLLGSGDVTFTEVTNQATPLTQSEPVLTQNSIDLIDSGAVSYLHNNLIDDSNVGMVTLLANAYARGLQKYLKRATTVQNIATTGDLIDGLYSITGIGSENVLDTVNGSITTDDIINLMFAVDETFREQAEFELNSEELKALLKLDYNGLGRNIPLVDMVSKTIMGRPYSLNNQMPVTMNKTTGARTGGDEATMLFGKPSEMQITFKGGLMFDASEHYKFIDDQTTFRGKIRWGMDVVNTEALARLTGIKR